MVTGIMNVFLNEDSLHFHIFLMYSLLGVYPIGIRKIFSNAYYSIVCGSKPWKPELLSAECLDTLWHSQTIEYYVAYWFSIVV